MTKNKNFQAAIFDLDGTLVNSPQAYRNSWVEVCAKHSYTFPPELYLRILGNTPAHAKGILQELFGTAFPFETIMEERKAVNARLLSSQDIAKHYAKEFLALLVNKNIQIAVATSSPILWAKELLTTAGLSDFFKIIIGREQVTEHKPAPECYFKTMEALGVTPAQTIIFEDSLPGFRAAKASGATVVGIPDLAPITKEALAYIDYEFTSFEQAVSLFS